MLNLGPGANVLNPLRNANSQGITNGMTKTLLVSCPLLGYGLL